MRRRLPKHLDSSASWIAKPLGPPRLLEAPRPRLKQVQRQVLTEILDQIPAHDAAHGFRPGRSVLTHARLHVGQPMVIRFDLEAFFAHVPMGRVLGVFGAAGYAEQVARSLAGLCSNSAPPSVLCSLRPTTPHEIQPLFRLRQKLGSFHLPQGAPTSPALANLCALGMDARLTALAHSWGLAYSRYADDLTFSGKLARATSLETVVSEIVRDEGFTLNRHKTRAMPSSTRQQITGVVVNAHVNVGRREFDQLKAILHRVSRGGAADKGVLQGRISWVEQLNPRKGAKLRAMFDAIDWARMERG